MAAPSDLTASSTLAVTAARAGRHELSLLVGGRCRACAERLPGGFALRGEDCPLCRQPTALTAQDRATLVAYMVRRGALRIGLLASAVGLSHLIVGWVPVASAIVVGLSAAWIRFQIVQPASRLLSPTRRRLAIWTARMGTAAFVAMALIVNELMTLIPIAGVFAKGVLSAAEVVAVAWLNDKYIRWQVEREDKGLAVGLWEYGMLAGTMVLLTGSAIALVAAAIASIAAIEALVTRLLV